MSGEPRVLDSLPDAPLTRDALSTIDEADGIGGAICPTWKGPTSGDGLDVEHTDDIIIATDSRIKYLSRIPGEGWEIERDETYTDDEEFEEVMDDVHDYAVELSREKARNQVSN